VDAADRPTFRRCRFEAAPGKRPLTVGPVAAVTELVVDGCHFDAIPDATWGVNLVTVLGARVVGSTFVAAPESRTARAVRVGAASRGVVILDNDLTGLTDRSKITDFAPDTVIRGNLGAPTEASGTAVIAPATTSVTVAHGLEGSGRTPSAQHIAVLATDPTGSGHYVTGVTATSFRIALPEPPVTQAPFAWRVDLTRR
jgi:hypothetical protein